MDIYLKNISRRWKKECEHAEKVIVLSPYINSPTANSVLSNAESNYYEIYTLFEPELFINKSSSLETLIKLAKCGCNIYHLDNLHSKIVLIPNQFASIGSQNLTSRVTKNLESSVAIKDIKMITKIETQVNKWLLGRRLITLEMMLDLKEKIKHLVKKYEGIQLESVQIDFDVKLNEFHREMDKREAIRLKRAEIEERKKESKIKRKTEVSQIKKIAYWLNPSSMITDQDARNFVAEITWWHTHSSGKPVLAKGFAKKVERTSEGFALKFGANYFLVELALQRVRRLINTYLNDFIEGKNIQLDLIKNEIVDIIRSSVANSQLNHYKRKYRIQDGNMMFGAQSIHALSAADYLIKKSWLRSLV
ncbi:MULTISPECIES: phospholipase D-like domain-containing protein [unclassified Pseudoalteromonas]|uniref:phospholipase D-like domain-containing protein n=1 Tax=unclassified Pseudoalteromonas TaxID=194690 RepID=UPI0005A7A8E5|nr:MULTISPECIES: phospholipase D-like domain-containing protein [unclassified Pseudoalteromonas]